MLQCCTAAVLLPGGASFKLTPQRYLFMVGRGEYCLGMFDNGWQGTLLGGILVRNVMVQVRRRPQRQAAALYAWHAVLHEERATCRCRATLCRHARTQQLCWQYQPMLG
jgi:hypothetical protein